MARNTSPHATLRTGGAGIPGLDENSRVERMVEMSRLRLLVQEGSRGCGLTSHVERTAPAGM